MKYIKTLLVFIALFALAGGLDAVSAAATFQVTAFACSPSEVAVNDVFSCTATITNVGDVSGAVNTLRLYPDSNLWLEQDNYVQSSGTSVGANQATDVIFSGLRSTKAGSSNSFSRISLDDPEDKFENVPGGAPKLNVVDVSLQLSTSASSTATGSTFTTRPTITAGGNINVVLTFTVNSGGCSIGNQQSQKSSPTLNHQQQWSPTDWTVTQGTSGDCSYTISAAASGSGGASKTASIGNSVTCTNCSSDSGSSTAGTSSGGGGGASIVAIVDLTSAISQELGISQSLRFTFGAENHTLTVKNITDTTAQVSIQSSEQTFTLEVGDEKQIDFEGDGRKDINLKLKSINIITKKALFILAPLYIPAGKTAQQAGTAKSSSAGSEGTEETVGQTQTGATSEGTAGGKGVLVTILIILIFIVVILIIFFLWKFYRKPAWERSIILKRFGVSG